MANVFAMLTSEQKTRVETLEIAEHSLLQLANDITAIFQNSYCREAMDVKFKANLQRQIVEVMAERDRMLGEIEYIKRG